MASFDMNFIAEIGLGKRKLSDYVHHYEELKYDTDDIHAQHHRHKRSTPQEEDRVRLHFHSHGRPFDLELERDHSVFHNNLIVERNNEAFKPDLSHIYHGKLIGEPNSHCFGAIRDGVFDGQIHTATDGIYYVERANRYKYSQNIFSKFVSFKIQFLFSDTSHKISKN